jgi:hypothetical protein
MLGLALGAAKMIGGAAKAKAGKGARVAKNMMGRGGKDDGGGGGAIVARPSSSIVPRPTESTAIVKAPKAKRTYVRLGMEGHLTNIRESVTGIDDYLKGTIAAQKKEIDDKKKEGSETRRAKQEQKLEKPKKNQKFNMKGMKMPKTGILDGIFNFLANVLMGMLVLKLMEFGGAIEKSGVLQFIGKAADFVLKFGGKLLDGLMTFIDKSYQLYDSLGDKVAEVFGEDGRKAFDDFSSGLNKVLNATIAIALVAAKLSGGMGKIPVNTQAIKQLKNLPGKNLKQKKKLLRRYISRNGRKAAERRFGKAAVQQLGGRFARSAATNLVRRTAVGIVGRAASRQVLRSMKNYISPIAKSIPLVGALIDFALNYFVFKEPIGRAAFMAIGAGLGAWIGGLLGTAIPIPLVGTAIGAFLGGAGGDILGGAIYDMIFGGQSEDAASQTVAAEGEVTGGQDTGDGGNGGTGGNVGGGGGGSGYLSGSDWKSVLRLIYKYEAGAGGFESMYPGTTLPGATKMTIAEVANKATGAVGAWQNLPRYLNARAKAVGLNPSTALYNKENQEKIAVYLIGRGQANVTKEMIRKNPKEAMLRLSRVWAAIPKDDSGVSYYAGVGNNAAHIKPQQMYDAFQKVKFEGGGYVGGKYDMNRIKTYASYEAGNSDPIVIPLPLPQQSQAPQMYEDNQQMTAVISGGERSNPFEFLDFQG